MAGALYQRTYPELNRQPHRRCVIKGRIDETRVVSMVQAGIPALSACFPDALTQPHRVVAHALVSASGIIQMAVVPESTMANDAVHRCVIQTVKKWTTGPLDSGDQLILILPFHVDTRGRLTMVPDPQEGLVTHALIARDSCP